MLFVIKIQYSFPCQMEYIMLHPVRPVTRIFMQGRLRLPCTLGGVRVSGEVARSAAERAAAGVWGRSPQRGLGAEPLVGG